MKSKRILILGLILFLGSLIVIRFSDYLPAGLRLFKKPITPPFAMNVQIPVSSMDDDFGDRRTVFETNLPADEIQQFYRGELPKHGWTYKCTVRSTDPPCGNAFWFGSESELIEVYDQGTPGAHNWQTYEIGIYYPDASGTRKVWLYIFTGAVRASSATSLSKPSESALLGNWRTTDELSGTDFLLRFYENGMVRILFPGLAFVNAIDGEYEWAENGKLRLIFHWYFQPADSANSSCKKYMPSFLINFCQHSLVQYDPESYPQPVAPQIPYPEPTDYGPYPEPALSPMPGAIDQIDEYFTIDFDVDKLILSHPSGISQIFHRVTGE